MSKLMAARNGGANQAPAAEPEPASAPAENYGYEDNQSAAVYGDGAETPAEQAESGDYFDEILNDVLSSDSDEAPAGGEDGQDQSRIDELYSEYAAQDDLPAAGDEEIPDIPDEPAANEPAALQGEEADGDDDVLMAALGYSKAPQIKEKEAPAKRENQRSFASRVSKADMASAFAWKGREYTSRAQTGEIRRDYDRELRMTYVRLGGTALFFIAILIFEIFGAKFGGALSRADYPTVHIMISLQLLVLCAALSWKRLLSGIIDVLRGAPSWTSLTSASVVLTMLYDLILTAAIGGKADVSFSLYNVPAAAALAMLAVADWLRLITEMRNFDKISSFESVCTLERDPEQKGAYRLHRGRFVKDYFRRTNRRSSGMRTETFVLAIACAAALILFFISLALKRSFVQSLNVFIGVIDMSIPVCAVLVTDLPFRFLCLFRADSYCAILNELDTGEFAHVSKIILDETDVFSGDSLKIVKVSQCTPGSDIFEIMSSTCAVCDEVGGTISRAFSGIIDSDDEDRKPRVRLYDVSEGGIEADVDGRRYTLGTVRYLTDRGIACRNCNDSEYASSTRGGTVFHIAENGREVFRYYMQYVPDQTFIELVNGMSERGIGIEIRCKDPNLSGAFIASMIGGSVTPEVVRIPSDAEEISDGGVIEGGLIADGTEWMSVIRAADSCQSFRAVSRINRLIFLAISILFAAVSVLLAGIGTIIGIHPMIIFAIQLAVPLISVLISRLLV